MRQACPRDMKAASQQGACDAQASCAPGTMPAIFNSRFNLDRTIVPLGLYDQANKRAWWMPWRQKAMKDVVVCDKPRGADKQALIRGFPNGETRPARVIMH